MAIQNAIDTPLAQVCRKAGSQVALSKLIGKHQTTISERLRKGGPVWAEDVLLIERELGLSRHDLRPDLYPREDAAPTDPARRPAEQPPVSHSSHVSCSETGGPSLSPATGSPNGAAPVVGDDPLAGLAA